MMFLFFLTLLYHVNPSGLTTNNCPTNFNSATANTTVSSSTASLVQLFYSNMFPSSQQASLRNSFYVSNSNQIYAALTTTQVLVPFLLIAVAFGITYIISICCCVFEKTCPPCQSWKRDFVRRPYQKGELKCVTIFAVIFASGIAITSLVALIFFPKLQGYISDTKCSMYTALDVAINGQLSSGWGGFSQLKTQVGNVSGLLSTASTSVSTNLANNQWLKTSMTALKDQNVNLYKNNFQSVVYSPNSTTTASAIAGNQPLPTITPRFIASGLGPNGTANTMVTDIDSGLRYTQTVSTQGYKVYVAAFLMANSANNITANTNKVMDSMTSNNNILDSVTVSIDAFSKSIFDQFFNWGLYMIQGILGFILAGSILIILGVIATYYFGLFTCRNSVHLGWVAYGVTYFGVVAVTYIFFVLGGVGYQFCDFYGGLVTNSSSFNTFVDPTINSNFNKMFDRLQTCFYGDGNILNQFNIKNQMSTVTNLYKEIETYLNMRDSTKATYINPNNSTAKITGWINAMDNYKNGIYVDCDPAITNEDNPKKSLQQLNKYANNNTGGIPPSCTNDYWVFDAVNCTGNTTETLYTADLTGSGTRFATTGFTCISFNSKFDSNPSSPIWTIGDIYNRYRLRRQCTNNNTGSYDSIISYAQALINYRDSRINLYQNLKDQLNSLLTANTNFNNQLTTFTTKVNSFYTSTSTLNSLVANQINGLTITANCTSVANNLRMVYNTFCINFIYTSVQFAICFLVLMIIMIGGMLTGNVFAIRYSRIEKDLKAVRPETPSIHKMHSEQLHSETFQKKQESSSSSSSDQD